jgi:hypothetical protein
VACSFYICLFSIFLWRAGCGFADPDFMAFRSPLAW